MSICWLRATQNSQKFHEQLGHNKSNIVLRAMQGRVTASMSEHSGKQLSTVCSVGNFGSIISAIWSFLQFNSPNWFFHVFPISGSSSLQHAKDVSSLKNINIYLGNPFKGPQRKGQSPKFLTSSKCHPTAASSAGSYCQLIDAWKSHPISSLHDLNLKSWIIPGIHLQVDSSLTAKAKTATESRPKGGNTCDWKDRSGPRRNPGWLIGLFVMVFLASLYNWEV